MMRIFWGWWICRPFQTPQNFPRNFYTFLFWCLLCRYVRTTLPHYHHHSHSCHYHTPGIYVFCESFTVFFTGNNHYPTDVPEKQKYENNGTELIGLFLFCSGWTSTTYSVVRIILENSRKFWKIADHFQHPRIFLGTHDFNFFVWGWWICRPLLIFSRHFWEISSILFCVCNIMKFQTSWHDKFVVLYENSLLIFLCLLYYLSTNITITPTDVLKNQKYESKGTKITGDFFFIIEATIPKKNRIDRPFWHYSCEISDYLVRESK